MKKQNLGVLIIILLIIVGSIIGVMMYKNSLRKKLDFTEENYEYMYNNIVTSFGNGEKFHVSNVKEEYIETLINVEGIEISFIGYFDSKENMYLVRYGKYLEDKPIYKNGSAGNILCITVNSNYSKDAYFNSNGGEK